jgi:hypothetical protein
MTFEPVDWSDEYEAAHDRQDARLGHRDTDTDETERLKP